MATNSALPRILIDSGALKNGGFGFASGTAKRYHGVVTIATPSGDTLTLTVGGASVTVTLTGSDTADTAVDALVAAWNASTNVNHTPRTAYDCLEYTVTVADAAPGAGEVWTLTINGASVSYTVVGGDDCLDITAGLVAAINASTNENWSDKRAYDDGGAAGSSVLRVFCDEDPEDTFTMTGTEDAGSGTITLATRQVIAVRADIPGVDFTLTNSETGGSTIDTVAVISSASRVPSNWTLTTATAATFVQSQADPPYTGTAHFGGYAGEFDGDASASHIYQVVSASRFRRGLRNGKVLTFVVHFRSASTISSGDIKCIIKEMEGATVRTTNTTNLEVTAPQQNTWKMGEVSVTLDLATYPSIDGVRVEFHNNSSATVYVDDFFLGYDWNPSAANGGYPQQFEVDWKHLGRKQAQTAGGFTNTYDMGEVRELNARWDGIAEEEWFTFADLWQDAMHGRAFTIWRDATASSVETTEYDYRTAFVPYAVLSKEDLPHNVGPGMVTATFTIKAIEQVLPE